MAKQGNPGANALAKILSERMHKESESPLVLDFGSIQADYSLKTNTFPVSLPKADYMICRHVGGVTLSTGGDMSSGYTEGDGGHSQTAALSVIQPGDRVLVAWVQSEAVVIDVIVPAKNI